MLTVECRIEPIVHLLSAIKGMFDAWHQAEAGAVPRDVCVRNVALRIGARGLWRVILVGCHVTGEENGDGEERCESTHGRSAPNGIGAQPRRASDGRIAEGDTRMEVGDERHGVGCSVGTDRAHR